MSSINNIVKKLRENRILSERKDYSKYQRDELIQMAQDGDQLAVEVLINSHKDFIRKMSSKYFLSSGDKDDVEQLATIAFWNALMKWDMTGDFEAYAGMIIKRKMTDELRKDSTEKNKSNAQASSLDEPAYGDDEGESSVGANMEAGGLSPEEEYLGRVGAEKLQNYIETKLTQMQRDVIKLHIRGYKIAEIQEELGMNYKQVENALTKVKGKIAEYMRSSYKESKKLKESAELEFTDEEKRVLRSILSKIDESSAALQESTDYSNFTEDELAEELDNIEEELNGILDELSDTHPEDRESLLDRVDELDLMLSTMEEYLSDAQLEKFNELQRAAWHAKDTEYTGPSDWRDDPYSSRGLRQSDFY